MPTFLEGAEPFSFQGNEVGCLLVHGFTGTPYEMRQLGVYLSRNHNYTVMAPALAGHATQVEECARTTWRDWYGSVENTYLELHSRCPDVFAIGLSLGGALVLHLAAHHRLKGVVSIATPRMIKHPLAPLFRLFPLLHCFVPYVRKDERNDDTQDPAVRAVHPGYDRTPTLAARSMIEGLLPTIQSELAKIRTPALLLQGRQDRTIPSDSMETFFTRLASSDKDMYWLEQSGHLVLEDYAKDTAFELIAQFIRRHTQKQIPTYSGLRLESRA